MGSLRPPRTVGLCLRAGAIRLAAMAVLGVPVPLPLTGAAEAVVLTGELPARILTGDPIPLRIALFNHSDRAVRCRRPYVSQGVRGLRLAVTGPGRKPLLPRVGERYPPRLSTFGAGHRWTVAVSLRRELVFPAKEEGRYDVTVTHPSTGASWRGRFEIAAPPDPARILARVKTPTFTGQIPARKHDQHEVLLRRHNDAQQLLYRNGLNCFKGTLVIAEVRDPRDVKAVAVAAPVRDLRCYGPDGRARRITAAELAAARRKKIFEETPYAEALDLGLKTRPIRTVRAVLVLWVERGELRAFSIGKYLPLPLFPKAPNDMPSEFLGLWERFRGYDVLGEAHTVQVGQQVVSILSVEPAEGCVVVQCRAKTAGKVVRLNLDPAGMKTAAPVQ